MNNLIEISPSFPSDTDSAEIAFVKMVKLNLIDASKAFFEIGFRLYEAQEHGYYKDLGFDNIVDCAEYHFGFKKTTTYDLINIYRVFCEKPGAIFIREHWRNFNQSQLSVIASSCSGFSGRLKQKYLSLFSPSDSVRKIKRATVCFKAVHNFNCSHVPFDVISSAKNADEVIESVEKYALNDFGYTKANYSKVITPELEAKYNLLHPSSQEDVNVVLVDDCIQKNENAQEFEVVIENSGCPENVLSYEDKEDFKEDFYNKFNMHVSNFLIDNCCFSTDDKTVAELAGEFIIMFFEYLKENKLDFDKVLEFGSFKPYDVRFIYDT